MTILKKGRYSSKNPVENIVSRINSELLRCRIFEFGKTTIYRNYILNLIISYINFLRKYRSIYEYYFSLISYKNFEKTEDKIFLARYKNNSSKLKRTPDQMLKYYASINNFNYKLDHVKEIFENKLNYNMSLYKNITLYQLYTGIDDYIHSGYNRLELEKLFIDDITIEDIIKFLSK